MGKDGCLAGKLSAVDKLPCSILKARIGVAKLAKDDLIDVRKDTLDSMGLVMQGLSASNSGLPDINNPNFLPLIQANIAGAAEVLVDNGIIRD